MTIEDIAEHKSKPIRTNTTLVLIIMLWAWIFATVILLTTHGVLYPGFLMLTSLPVAFALVVYVGDRKAGSAIRQEPTRRIEVAPRRSIGIRPIEQL